MNCRKYSAAVVSVILLAVLAVSGCTSKNDSDGSQLKVQNSNAAPDVDSEVKLGDYKGLKVTVEKLPDITDADVDAAIQSIVDNAMVTNENTSRAVAVGDTVNVSYTGFIDDEEIPDSSVEDYNILIGSGVFFDGAESHLVDQMPGETVEIPVVFPTSYPKADLVGKSAVYKVTINYIDEPGQGELNDDFVASISDCKTVDEFRTMMKDNLVTSRENERKLARQDAVWNKVLENSRDIAFNASDVEAIASEYRAYDEAAAEDFDMTMEEYVKEYQGMTLEEYNAAIEELAENEIREALVVDSIAEAENINGSNATEEELTRCSQIQGYESVDAYKTDRSDSDKEKDVKKIRVIDLVVSSAVITEE